MDMNFEQKVRERAYHIWMSAGMMHGSAHEHWVIAEKAVANETGEPVSARPKRAAAAKAMAKTSSTKTSSVKPAAAKAPKTVAAKLTAPKPSKAKH